MTLRVRRERAGHRGFRLKQPVWVDPFPFIPGTHPEKLLFAALYRRGIYFRFQDDFPIADKHKFPILQDRDFKPDFIVPEYKIIYDPYGDFAHSQPRSFGKYLPDGTYIPGADVWKQVYYESKGYEFIHPWTSEIEKYGADWMIDQSQRIHHAPQFKLTDPLDIAAKPTGYRLGPNLGLGANSTAIANHLRAKPHPKTMRVGQRKLKRGR
jgi:hypothetical protein